MAQGVSGGMSLHRIERLMREQALRARPRLRRLPSDAGERQIAAVASNVLDRDYGTSARRPRTRSGLRTSPTSGRRKAGSTWLR